MQRTWVSFINPTQTTHSHACTRSKEVFLCLQSCERASSSHLGCSLCLLVNTTLGMPPPLPHRSPFPLLWTGWLGTYRSSLFSLHFLFIPLPLGIKGNEGNPLMVCQVRGTMEKWKELEGGCDSSWGSSHFAGVCLAQLFEMAPLACRLWGRALYEDAWVGKQTIKVSESSLTL